ncbi:hypothetical protein [Bacillus sp. FJAT-45350]|uniref:hypothetical protein n=1 Tax=Bacillus sp. FJAT-45350 TaxID=2011014 RepID=UPI0015CCC152|nr:hypothetical protein [Bacillus sp. FJAT-45350]
MKDKFNGVNLDEIEGAEEIPYKEKNGDLPDIYPNVKETATQPKEIDTFRE